MNTFLTVVAVWVAFFLFACKKDEPQGYGEEGYCNCGVVVEDSIHTATTTYLLIVENECSGNERNFIVDPLIYSAYYKGDRICINNQSPW
jgi:hypothetical protein